MDSYQLSQEFLKKLGTLLHLVFRSTELHNVTFLRLVRKRDDNLQKNPTNHMVIYYIGKRPIVILLEVGCRNLLDLHRKDEWMDTL